jgi:lambda family phage tail tape measure protein
MATKKVNIDIIAKDKSKQALNKIRGNLDGLKKSVFNLRNAFIGLGAGLVIRSIVNTGKEIEALQVRLKFLFGSVEEGSKAFEEMTKYASKVPFSLAEIQKGSGSLAVVAKDAEHLGKLMEMTGNAAALTGLDFATTADQIQRSLSGGIAASILFRERGLKALLGFKQGARVTAEETAKVFEEQLGKGGKFYGVTDDLAKTLEGTLSMIGDKVFNFKRVILEAGFFPELKKQFKTLDDFLANESKLLDKMATKIGKGLAIAVRELSEAIIFVKDNVDKFALALGGLIALKVAGFFYATMIGLNSLTTAMWAFNFATKKNIIFGSIMVFAGAMGFLIKKFLEFKGALDVSSMSIDEMEEKIKDLENRKLTGDFFDLGIDDDDQFATEKITNQINFLTEAIKQKKNAIVASGGPQKHANELIDKYFKHTLKLKEEKAALIKEVEHYNGSIKHANELVEKYFQIVTKAKNTVKEYGVNMDHLNELMGKYNIYTVEGEDSTDNLTQSMTHLNELMGKYNIYTVDALDNSKTLWGSFKTGFTDTFSDAINLTLQFEKAGKRAFTSFDKELRNALRNGKFNFNEFARSVIIDLTAIIIKQQMILLLQKAIAMFKTFSFGFGFFEKGTMASANTFQHGGFAKKGQPAIVGEAGPELIIPRNNSEVIPNNKLSDLGKNVTVNFNINTVDARGFNELLVNSRGVIVNMINSAVNEKGRMAIV